MAAHKDGSIEKAMAEVENSNSPWYVKLGVVLIPKMVNSQGVGNVILLMMALGLLASLPTGLRLAESQIVANASQTEIHRKIEEQYTNVNTHMDAVKRHMVRSQSALDKIMDKLGIRSEPVTTTKPVDTPHGT
jgi:hypothetical protein